MNLVILTVNSKNIIILCKINRCIKNFFKKLKNISNPEKKEK